MSQHGYAARPDPIGNRAIHADPQAAPKQLECVVGVPNFPARQRADSIDTTEPARSTALQAQDLKAKWRRFRYSWLYAR
ncbi:MAG: hypothetical protein FJX62_17630 [Alphaproteobacteria bacterium]|nr:hypothetical protein [Alphaproteobacteria bacterium]